MDRRREELERKKNKLAELRRAREDRRNAAAAESQKKDSRETITSRDRQDLDDLISSLVGDSIPSSSSASSVAGDLSASVASLGSAAPAPSDAGPGADAAAPAAAAESNRYRPVLSTEDFVILDVPPKERVMYTKESQTVDTAIGADEPQNEATSPLADKAANDIPTPPQEPSPEKEIPKPRVLSDEERRFLFQSEHFIEFIDRSSKLVERALTDKFDLLRDYTLTEDNSSENNSGKGVKAIRAFYDDKWSKNRTVMDVGWSPKYPELLLAAYNKNAAAIHEPDGLVILWNLHLPDRPEFVFHSQSDVTAAIFSEFHPNLVIGGTYSGQVLIWDTRAKNLPVLKTPLSSTGHTHPVYSMTMVGTQNAHNIVTASTDGLVCSWQVDMLAQPQEMLELVHPTHGKSDEIAVTTLGFPANETGTFWVGTEEGNVYQANRYDRAGSKGGINPLDTYVGHHGMVTGLHFHPQVGFSDLFLTSSVDWTVKLWRTKNVSKTTIAAQQLSPIHSFEESDDYVYDVRWSPSHPAVFGCVDGTGRFDVYDLNQETEVPTVSTLVGSGKALNKLQWDAEGRKAAIGSSDGQLYVYDVGELAQPDAEAAQLFQKTVTEIVASGHRD
ncbi:WD40-repeat-containing domain protein [Zopfochytrium polystomum]|nr:WD40-repeat-containing domain protein [Zopfochytrium polystomum]